MKYVEVVARAGSSQTVLAIAEKVKAHDFRLGGVGDDGMCQMRLLVSDNQLQLTLDALQNILGAQPTARIVVLPVEASLPRLDETEQKKQDSAPTVREKLYEEIERSARLDSNFIVLVFLSTIVAAIGLIENNVAVVIGAMVIAPLLGPNLALSLATALGDPALLRKAARTFAVGILLAIGLSVPLGMFWPGRLDSFELMSRTVVSYDSIALALASGAAAALSLTTGLSSVLVGVMVAVALLPPAATLGIMLGTGEFGHAMGAGLLLAVNVVSVNLSSKIVFIVRGVRPRTWYEKRRAKYEMLVYITAWIVTLAVLAVLIYFRMPTTGAGQG
ncbi:MAG: TIGR00341 family protein [Gammaproteobacteria bacterium]|jgi:uncharacterized hydrophobic protein (TIGR00341 family)|nr:TIGR00341 family protein [Gammaproteobacteria bacterium]